MVDISVDTLARIFRDCKNVVGVKDATGNLVITDSTTNLGAAVSSGGSGTAQLVVHPDCSVSMATTDGSSHYVGVARVTDGHIGLYLVGTDPGITVFYTALGTPRETP